MIWIVLNGRYQIVNKPALNNSQDIVLTSGIIALVANIATKGVVMKEEPNPISHDSKFFVLLVESSFINLCDFSKEEDPSLLDVVVPEYVKFWPVKEQPPHLDVPQCCRFVEVMFLTLHACSKLKSLNYNSIIIEFVNYLPMKFNGEILFELPLVCQSLGHSEQLQGMDRKYDNHVWCKLQTNNINNLFRLGFKTMKCLGHLCC